MPVSAQLEAQTLARNVHHPKLPAKPMPRSATVSNCNLRPNFSAAELAFRIYAVFRAHPHICNVLTHISRAKWERGGTVHQFYSQSGDDKR